MKKAKKFLTVLIASIMLFSAALLIYAGEYSDAPENLVLDQMIKTNGEIVVNGRIIDAPPVNVDGANNLHIIPLRASAEALGLNVSWNGELRTVTITDDEVVIQLEIDGKYHSVTEVEVEHLDFGPPAQIIEGHTYVPIYFFQIMFGFETRILDGQVVIGSTVERQARIGSTDITIPEDFIEYKSYEYGFSIYHANRWVMLDEALFEELTELYEEMGIDGADIKSFIELIKEPYVTGITTSLFWALDDEIISVITGLEPIVSAAVFDAYNLTQDDIKQDEWKDEIAGQKFYNPWVSISGVSGKYLGDNYFAIIKIDEGYALLFSYIAVTIIDGKAFEFTLRFNTETVDPNAINIFEQMLSTLSLI